MPSLDHILSSCNCLVGYEQITKLSNGLSHQCFKVTTDKNILFLKIFLNQTEISAEHWQQQIDVQIQAANIGLAPKIIESSYVQGYLVTGFIDGMPLRLSDLSLPDKLAHAAYVIYQCQQLKSSATVFQPHNIIEHLLKDAKLNSAHEKRIKDFSSELITTLSIDPTRLVLSHGDVNFDNIMVCQQQGWLIDWEYCVLAEPEFDLGMCLAINNIEPQWHQSLISHFNSYLVELPYTSYSVDTLKVTRYFELSVVINALWFYAQNKNLAKGTESTLHQQSINALETLLN